MFTHVNYMLQVYTCVYIYIYIYCILVCIRMFHASHECYTGNCNNARLLLMFLLMYVMALLLSDDTKQEVPRPPGGEMSFI